MFKGMQTKKENYMDDSKMFWMNEELRAKYQNIREEIKTLRSEHSQIMVKFRNKTSSEEERKRMKELIKRINKLEKERQNIDKQNPTRGGNILKHS